MLARPETQRCIECGETFGTLKFWYYEGKIENGPAYWSDRGILCSPHCSLSHFRRREAEDTLPDRPTQNPFEFETDDLSGPGRRR